MLYLLLKLPQLHVLKIHTELIPTGVDDLVLLLNIPVGLCPEFPLNQPILPGSYIHPRLGSIPCPPTSPDLACGALGGHELGVDPMEDAAGVRPTGVTDGSSV